MLKVSLRPGDLSVGSHRIHYAWVIVGVASVMWMITSAVRFAPGVLVPYFQDLFGWSIFGIFGVFALHGFSLPCSALSPAGLATVTVSVG